ncbi:MAG: FG-GAP-like repeat-containing protein, partial [Candidatus Parabeggiatoa sp.]|nr:FG-GAP-like repeat-containing protein [Candidatus Parabeggiatoa sp.]
IAALDWLHANRETFGVPLAAINMSVGGKKSHSQPCDEDARAKIIQNPDSVGIATIISAGNNGYADGISAPACISKAISVGATDKDNKLWPQSNRAGILDLLAPGVGIESALPGDLMGAKDGTSMAAPHVAGAWAILKAANPQASVAEILGKLKNTGQDVGGMARIQVDAALSLSKTTQLVFTDSGQELGNSNSPGVALGDLDSDGDLDAFVANYSSQADTVWFNDGKGNFADSGQRLDPTNSYSNSVRLVDLDHDNDLDAFVLHNGGSPSKIWWNDGKGFFSDSGQNLYNSDAWGIDLADLDSDGDLDAYIANAWGIPDKVWLNDGSGHFSDSGQQIGNFKSHNIALGDLDADGDIDVFIPAGYDDPNRVFLNDGSGIFEDSGQSLGNGQSGVVKFIDIDSDNDLDALVTNSENQPNQIWLNDGTGIFSKGQELGNSSSYKLKLADLDQDGDIDAFIANSKNQPNKVWLNDGTGTFVDSGLNLGNSNSQGIALGDLDGDGDLDAFVGNQGANKVWLNNSTSTVVCPKSTCNVATDGSNETGDGSEAKPFATIQHGIDTAKDGYTVLVHAGTYVENVKVDVKNLTLKSTDGAEKTVIDGNQKGTVLAMKEVEEAVIDGFTITNGNGQGPLGGLFYHVGPGGVSITSSAPVIKNLIVTGNVTHDGGGVSCGGNVATPTLINVQITNNTSDVGGGIYIDGIGNGICNMTLRNVTVANNHAKSSNMGGGLFSHSKGKLNAVNSIFWNNTPNNIHTWGTPAFNITYSDVEGGWNGDGNFDVDPLFENGYHLSDNSPAIGAGTSTDAPETDLEGNPRSNPPSMGAYEGVFISTISLTLTKTGNGDITTTDNIINCGETCQADYEVESTVTLTATPATGSRFTGWSGDCSGTSATTIVTMDTAKSCAAHFEKSPGQKTITINKTGKGRATVKIEVKAEDRTHLCKTDCSEMTQPLFTADEIVLTATPAKGFIFKQWAGECSGTDNRITVPMMASKTCTADFDLDPNAEMYPLPVNNKEGSQGRLVAKGGIDCGEKCTAYYPGGQKVRLEPTSMKPIPYFWVGKGIAVVFKTRCLSQWMPINPVAPPSNPIILMKNSP